MMSSKSRAAMFVSVGFVLAIGCGDGAARSDRGAGRPQASPGQTPVPPSSSPTTPEPMTSAYAGPLPSLPTPAFPLARPELVVRAVYEFAARRPDVLRYVPCFCGCERSGHQHNEDCFVAGRDPDGRPHWEIHGMGGGTCIDVARDAMQMHNGGASVSEIRSAIDRKYRASFSTSTPTPAVPGR